MPTLSNMAEVEAFAKNWVLRHTESFVLGLSGPLGVGKTAFVRSVLNTLSQQAGLSLPKVTSPSFVLHQNYVLGERTIEHFDLYRLEKIDENQLIEIGYYESLERIQEKRGSYLFVEWPENCLDSKDLHLQGVLRLEFSTTNPSTRIVTEIKGGCLNA